MKMTCEGTVIGRMLSERKLPPLKGRKEMLDMLLKLEYGFIPEKPTSVMYEEQPHVLSNCFCREFCSGNASIYYVTATFTLRSKQFSFPFQVAIPKGEGKFPFIVSINFRETVPDLWMPIEEIIDNGFAVLSFCYEHITTDDRDFSTGLAGVLFNEGKRALDDCGKIAMWAWAAQRILDYAETLDSLDMSRAAVCGHSRLGKTALLAAATDERFQFCYSNDSGTSGAALTRGNTVETKAMICKNLGQWFSRYYCEESPEPEELPFDQHYLLGAIAPRYVLVGSAAGDYWADTVSEFLGAVAASQAYETFGLTGLICDDVIPKYDAFLPDGHIGYHIRPGLHYFSRIDWQRFMQFIRIHS